MEFIFSLITYQLALREFTAQQTLQNSTSREENTKTGTDSGPIFIAGSDDLAVRNLKEVQNITGNYFRFCIEGKIVLTRGRCHKVRKRQKK